MSLKPSYSAENLMLPVSDPPNDEDREWLLKSDSKTFRGRRIYAAISYMSCAVLLVLFNKAVLSSYDFPSASVVTLLQVVISVGLIVFGAFIAGARDFSFDAYAYAIVFLSNITTVIYLATIARVGKTCGLNSFGLMWCNGIICGPFLLIWTLVRGDLKVTLNFPYLLSPGFIVVLLFSCILAFFLNYSIFLNTTLNSALTQSICGNLKDLFTISFGWIIFGGLTFDFWNVVGQLLGFAGSGLFAYNKLIGK